MSATPRPSQKKQATLTSFFTPRSSAPLSSSPGADGGADAATNRDNVLPSRKRPLEEEDADQSRNRGQSQGPGSSKPQQMPSLNKRAAKRVRATSEDGDYNDENNDQGEGAIAAEEQASPSSPLRSSGRTDRYLYEDGPQRPRGDESQATDGRLRRPSPPGEAEKADAADEDDAAARREKEALHRRFVQKLGHPDSLAKIRRRNFVLGDGPAPPPGDEDGADEAAEEDDEAETARPTTNSKKKGSGSGSGGAAKLTPMEVQFLAIKRQHPDTLLVVEVGYKFRFFGEDARTAARELGIVCIPGKVRYDEHPSEAHLDRFASASIPVPRLPVHVKRLVAAGHKVGVVRQMETAALKKAGDNRNAPFVRKLTSVYTKGTYVDELGELEAGSGGKGTPSSAAAGYLLCLTESPAHGTAASGTDEKVAVGILAVQPGTGDILYDSFEDGFLRNEIETRLLHIAPCELLIVGALSRATEKLVQHLSGSATNVFGDRTRVERVTPGQAPTTTDAHSHVTRFYADKIQAAAAGEGDASATLLEKVLRLPAPVTVCLSAMITHLTEYGLEHIFDLTKYFESFTTRQHMLLSGTTLESLEVYRNATDHGVRGSLLWALDKTQTRFGHRLLRKWIGRPLLDRAAVEARLAAVEELRDAEGTARRDKLDRLLSGTKTDLERSLIRIYYGKCSRPELVAVLQTLQRISGAYAAADAAAEASGFSAPVIREALAAIPAIHDTVVAYLDKINGDAARRDDKYSFFREAEESEDIMNHKMGIAAVEMDLEACRADMAETLGGNKKRPPPPYVTVAGIEYLVEVPNTDLKRVPASWIKISGTKKVSRFHAPAVVRLLAERDQHKEALAAACDAAFAALLASLAACYQPLRDAVAALATLDCLLSLARVAALPGYTKPTLLPEEVQGDDGSVLVPAPPTIDIRGGRHPVAEHTLPSGYIPFTTRLAGPAPRALLITGPNMGGKSSFVRAVALLTLLAQIGSFVPAEAMALTPVDAVFTRMGARDNLFAGESTFMVEVSETAAILRAATPRSLVVLDELGRGTSTHDGAAIAEAVLTHVATTSQCLTLFITHYQNLGRVADSLGPPPGLVQNVHMRFTASKRRPDPSEASPGTPPRYDSTTSDTIGDEVITFLYEVAPGVAHRSYGLNVARLAHIPPRVLEVAACKSRELEDDMRMRRLRAAARLTATVVAGGPDDASQLDHLIASIEQL